jgi:hypothetical protein
MISPTHDLPFKYVFAQAGETEELLAAFLNQLLLLRGEREIKELTYRNVENTPSDPRGRKLILDVRVVDQRGVTYNIEVQRENQGSIISRALFQQSRISNEQLQAGSRFDELQPVVIILLCNYSIFPDTELIRLFRFAPFSLSGAQERHTLPYRSAHFDSEVDLRYRYLNRRLHQAEASLDLLQIYLLELDKHPDHLLPDQQAWIKYLVADHPKPTGDTDMNERRTYEIPEGASPEARQWIERAQARLDYFAGQPEYRQAYEREILELMQHNTLLAEGRAEGLAEGRAEGLAEGRSEGLAEGRHTMLLKSIEGIREIGLTDEQITQALKLTPDEVGTYLKTPLEKGDQ